jgi:uncharacterized Fe-S center protein
VAPKVYYSRRIDSETIRAVFASALADAKRKITKNDQVAIKVHFGEKGNTRYVPPRHIRPVIETLKPLEGEVFLTDANTLYRGMRLNATDHLKIAKDHGFEILKTKILIADGQSGEEEVEVVIPGRIFSRVKVARRIARANAVIVISHFKGHILFGFGGAIKNLGMGCGSRAGKLEMHSKIKPYVNADCISCGQCVENCPADAISIQENEKALIDPGRCIGCAECIAICCNEAIEIPWHGATSLEVMERCAEYALGAAKDKTCVCVNFVNHITKDCDCMPDSEIIGKDVGLVASVDPVACDQASFDLVLKKHRNVDIFKKATHVDGTHITRYGTAIGLGEVHYTLVEL